MAHLKKRKLTHRNEEESVTDYKKPRNKHGRSQLRTVTRTAARKPVVDEEEMRAANELSDNDTDAKEDASDSDQIENVDNDVAYKALLTLLKSDHNVKKNKKPKDDDSQEVDESDGDEVAGINLDEDAKVGEEDEDVALSSGDDEDEDDNRNGLLADPYEVHFNKPTDEYVTEQEKLVVHENRKWSLLKRSSLGDLHLLSLLSLPPGIPINSPLSEKQKLHEYPIKKRILDAYESELSTELSSLESAILSPILNYQDVLYQYRNFKNTSYRKLYVLHALNHIYKTRDRILKNTSKLHSFRESNLSNEEPEFRDQGFTRPKVLILLPTRNACYEVVESLIKLSGSEQQENKKKFTAQFFAKAEPPSTKPSDFIDAFKGNNSDFFCIGLKFTRKSLKLYSSFYSSDIIIASPIGLSMILENPDKSKRQYDFLSSIEVLIVDKANQLEMQNWDHVTTVMKYLNKIPKEFHDADFSRIRMWSINDQATLLRQTLVFCEYLTPIINHLFTKSLNLSGKVKFKPVIAQDTCIMNSIGLRIKQIFQRFESPSPSQDPDSRFKFFINTILPSLMKSTSYEDGIMIFVPSYFDYLRIKSYLKTSTKFNFGSIDEYTSQSKLTKTRHEFIQSKIKTLLYTERLHYFRRFELAGVKTLIMYGIPSNPIFYKELVQFIGKSVYKQECDLDLALVKIIYSKWDAVSLERIVGNERAPVLCNSVNELYEFR